MPLFLLHVEAVNLGAVYDDTDDLSTRRGGGLLALSAVRQLTTTVSPPNLRNRLRPVATGASVGLFEFEAADDVDAERVAEQVREHFRTGTLEYPKPDGNTGHLPLTIGTFVADVVPRTADPNDDAELVTAHNRWRQLQEPTVSLAGLWVSADAECYYDCVRPAKRGARLPKDRDKTTRFDVSPSVLDRHLYGRGRRQQFYEEELGERVPREFTNEFAEIGDRAGLTEAQAPTNTAGKLAVFYADGNKFGAIGREKLAAGLDAYRAWSEQLQDHHRGLLRQVLARAEADPAWRTAEGRVRLETLLWGGDEIVWVVPGWKGWELAERFFAAEHRVAAHADALTYSAGLVFCGVRTPIHNVIRLARRLGDVAKTVAKKAGGHRLAYEVLESFDDVTSDFDHHRRKWLPAGLKAATGDPLTLDAAALPALLPHLRAVAAADDFPTRQLYRLNAAWRNPAAFDKPDLVQANALRRLRGGDAGRAFAAAERALSDTAWVHLLQMLPYVPAGGGA